MNTIIAFFLSQQLRAEHFVAQRSTRTNEEGSQTTDNLLWVVAVIAIAGIGTAAVLAYTSGLIGKIG
ncbi:hypothetical protein [Propioniciclava soli]|uniref:hypothetical protein n=1 Tax=Propioniciclava soli TaxID=2775081 RepID=UPI001E5A0274|nr:hypothetical protein [Propioniciclava soli]